MPSRIYRHFHVWRRRISRSRLASRLLGIQTKRPHKEGRGLILLQLDGLGRTQLERALRRGRMPFARQLVLRDDYELDDFYSGLPSSTPAVQGEIFFGVRTAVPSFSFYDREAKVERRMFEPESARLIASELERQSEEPLLKNGSSYSNIYVAGADCGRFCSERLDLPSLLEDVSLARIVLLFTLYWPKFVRIAVLGIIETVIASVDCIRGLIDHQDLVKELKFVPTRLGICVVLRELVEFMIRLDIDEGVPVIHANLLGYDEQAHRRGPDSRFAHWTLGGIDRVIRDISRAALRSQIRDYDIVIFSDHGQERTLPFVEATGKSLKEVVQETFTHLMPARHIAAGDEDRPSTLEHRGRSLLRRGAVPRETPIDPENIVVTAMGPVAQIYVPAGPEHSDWQACAARTMVREGGVPMVLYVDEKDRVKGETPEGAFDLPEDGLRILGEDHPFGPLVVEDLVDLCRHRHAGDLVACGWRRAGQPMSFAKENGAHGGIGREETHGFILAPKSFLLPKGREKPIRGVDLYHYSRAFLGRLPEKRLAPAEPLAFADPLRVLTYNIHSCVGMDGRLRPDRVARVIATADPDIVALQEVDAYRPRSRHDHQAEILARHLGMHMCFYSLLEHEDREEYGLAILSKFPLAIEKKSPLTNAHPEKKREARGALWAKIKLPGGYLHVVNTHFGLGGEERRQQAEILLGEKWLSAIPRDEPLILCGDFNSTRNGRVYRQLTRRLIDTQTALPLPTKHRTFASIAPLLQLDHIFVNHRVAVQSVRCSRTPQAILASDHLPLWADFRCRFPQRHAPAQRPGVNPTATRALENA